MNKKKNPYDVTLMALLLSSAGILTPVQFFHHASLAILFMAIVYTLIGRSWRTSIKLCFVFFLNTTVLFLDQILSSQIMGVYGLILMIIVAGTSYKEILNTKFKTKGPFGRELVKVVLAVFFLSISIIFAFLLILLFVKFLQTTDLTFNPHAFKGAILPSFLLGIALPSYLFYLPFPPFLKLTEKFYLLSYKNSDPEKLSAMKVKDSKLASKLALITLVIYVIVVLLAKDEYYRFGQDSIEVDTIWSLSEDIYSWTDLENATISVGYSLSKTGTVDAIQPTIRLYMSDDETFTFRYEPFLSLDTPTEFLNLIDLLQENNIPIIYQPIDSKIQSSLGQVSEKSSSLVREMYLTEIVE